MVNDCNENLNRIIQNIQNKIKKCQRKRAQQQLDSNRFNHSLQITVSFAQSLDGSIARKKGEQTHLSCQKSLEFTHLLRANHDAILVGVNTILIDDPRLTTRLVEGKNPQTIILDPLLRVPLHSKLFTNSQCVRPWIFGCSQNATDIEKWKLRQKTIEKAGGKVFDLEAFKTDITSKHSVNIIKSTSLGFQELDFSQIFRQIELNGLFSVMIEGGARIINSILRDNYFANYINNIIITISPIFLDGLPYVNNISHIQQWKIRTYTKANEDIIVELENNIDHRIEN